MPRIATVAPEAGLTIGITWAAGSRVGKTDVVDLSPILLASKQFRQLRKNPVLFATVHTILSGEAIAWGKSDEIDLSATSVHNLAEEAINAHELRSFIRNYRFTETSLAATLNYSRRQIVAFVNGRARIPRIVALACHYIALKHPLVQRNTEAPKPEATDIRHTYSLGTAVVSLYTIPLLAMPKEANEYARADSSPTYQTIPTVLKPTPASHVN